jgi:hypothetical protein
MILRRLTENLRAQNWTAIAIEFLIVVMGVFIGTQVANWNQQRLAKIETERMLEQLVPELRSQVEFYDANRRYYAVTRRYAETAFAGWSGARGVDDNAFVIAAYQASQITGLGIDADSWSLTFGGDQLRNITDPKVRRNLELVLTADYSPVSFETVATRYREQVRQVIPIDLQDRIRRECGDRNVLGKDGAYFVALPTRCALTLDPAKAKAAAASLRAKPNLVGELHWHLAAVAAYLANFHLLVLPMRDLHRELSVAS